MPDVVCSLINNQAQSIPAGPNYVVVRFPFDSDGESSDVADMHPQVQPDTGQATTYNSSRSGLIWPAHTAWAQLHALMYWDEGSYTEIRDRFVRDPLGLSSGVDSTCTEDHAVTPGGQYIAKSWAIRVYPGTPVGLMVRHNGSSPARLAFAEFKLSYHLDPELP